jgi:two-component system, LuxR family, response regulator FixJ
MPSEPTIFVVDDDESMRISVCALACSMGIRAKSFSSAEEFLDQYEDHQPGCLVTDVRMLGMSGLELQETLRERDVHLPVIVMTAYAETRLTVRALRNGALNLLEKPFEENELWDSIREALAQDARNRAKYEHLREIRHRIERLTPLRREVMNLIVAGKANKCIAAELDIGVRTVESRRREVLQQMKAESVADLVRMVMEADLEARPIPLSQA